jgi:hypothetical protein
MNELPMPMPFARVERARALLYHASATGIGRAQRCGIE